MTQEVEVFKATFTHMRVHMPRFGFGNCTRRSSLIDTASHPRSLQIITGEVPFSWLKFDALIITAIFQGTLPYKIDSIISRHNLGFLERGWGAKPEDRPTMSNICEALGTLPAPTHNAVAALFPTVSTTPWNHGSDEHRQDDNHEANSASTERQSDPSSGSSANPDNINSDVVIQEDVSKSVIPDITHEISKMKCVAKGRHCSVYRASWNNFRGYSIKVCTSAMNIVVIKTFRLN